MTTVLLNLHNAGFYELNSMILAMGICYGGAAQIIAGIMEWRRGNTFATTAFISYGLFWLSLVALILLPKLGWACRPTTRPWPPYLRDVGIVHRRRCLLAHLRLNRALQIVFATLTILFFLLAIGDFTAASPGFKHATGYEGIFADSPRFMPVSLRCSTNCPAKVVLPLGQVTK